MEDHGVKELACPESLLMKKGMLLVVFLLCCAIKSMHETCGIYVIQSFVVFSQISGACYFNNAVVLLCCLYANAMPCICCRFLSFYIRSVKFVFKLFGYFVKRWR